MEHRAGLVLAAVLLLGACGGSATTPRSAESYCARVRRAAADGRVEQTDCGISRGPKSEKKIALVFTAGSFCEGGPTFLDTLQQYRSKASFFLLSEAVRTKDPASKCPEVLPRLVREGHYVGPHSDTHPDLVDRQGGRTTIARRAFDGELERSIEALRGVGVTGPMRYWIPPSETFNEEIAEWSAERGFVTVHLTDCPRTRGDYLPVDARGGIFSNTAILTRVSACAASDGLRGAILFFHLGIGPNRAEPDKFHHAFPALMQKLVDDGYTFVRIDELLDPVMERRADMR
jgi:peptidoglycan/xylan/chitin deacetylase (PgdA/CDA1 family)